jgi:sugar/nucleoside kinase (ribokinase family)
MGAWAGRLMDLARQRGVPVVLDVGLEPSRAARERIVALAALADTLLVSLEEAEALTGKAGAESLEAIATCGAREVIVKRGAGGCQFLQGRRWWVVPPVEVQAVDTTGAGDAFAAGYIAGRLRGWAMADAVALANACGAAAATVFGAGEQMPSPADVMRVLEAQPAGGRETSAAKRVLRLLRTRAESIHA